MKARTRGLGIALAYPEYALATEPPAITLKIRDLAERAGRGEEVDAEAAQILRESPGLNEWVAQLLEDYELKPPHLQANTVRSVEPLPGEHGPIFADRYECRNCGGTVFYRAFVAEAVPPCSFCKRELSRS